VLTLTKVAENGSGRFMSDLTFIGGTVGIHMLYAFLREELSNYYRRRKPPVQVLSIEVYQCENGGLADMGLGLGNFLILLA
jgi:hypothetical protein